MDYMSIIQEFQGKSDEELALYAKNYKIPLSKKEIQKLRPLLSSFSIQWVLMGIPDQVMRDIEKAIGKQKTADLLKQFGR
ncbi:hypothetical protein MKZ08_06400 [Viridibacillus sp. FSL R5-0477]|uniref:Uncharacterized protein n=1 Tax=Viridibacillus arenosi FSL R5-213 TaxID=1227360 RepID=W4ER59_9BACL|nr:MULTISPECIES: hypothetical protein [Viridibacillus]ETT82311.1 hypothetical protein C176_15012 [Viridibacillus arenosi FSL R5-213]OMC83633.1 hypothetical protein BK128_18155 [Viridibacillus sp. FSL H7-0596]OMC85294.1 hypothetical protein BK130_00550 [Viridibacillus sp. FSL H8-0123]OMC92588.1 hypothetical protein BK137_05985 [Viridibacillus arenosi]